MQRQWQSGPAPCGISHVDIWNPCLPEYDECGWLFCCTCGLTRNEEGMTVTTAAEAETEPRYSFTRDELINALTHLEVHVATSGPIAGKVLADSMADAIIEALERLA